MRPLPLSGTVAAVTTVLVGSFGVGVASARTSPATTTMYPLSAHTPALADWNRDSTGVYTMEQAERGLDVFNKVCSECHEVEDLTDEIFVENWQGRSVFELYELVRTTMPDEEPGTLTREQYLDAVSYVLKINNQPAGPAEFVGDSVSSSLVILQLGPMDGTAVKPDTMGVKPDTMAVPDTMGVKPDTMAIPDTMSVEPDTMAVAPDTLSDSR